MKFNSLIYRKHISTIILLFVTTIISAREVVTLHRGWRFSKGASAEAYKPDYDDSGWKSVTIPHDWAIEGPVMPDGDGNTGKLPWRDEAWYRRKIDIPMDLADKEIYLLFDGVMAFPEVFVNGSRAGGWDYGYNSFYLDITGLVEPGKDNILAVHVDTRNHVAGGTRVLVFTGKCRL